MRATYTLELELSYNTWTDVTADWFSADDVIIERGIEPGQRVAGIGRMEWSLYNPDGRYTPDHAACRAGFEAGIGVRLKASDGTSTYPLFFGRITRIDPIQQADPGGVASRRVRITALDEMHFAHRLPLEVFPLLLNTRAREVINHLVNAAFTPPSLYGYGRLDHPVIGKLNSGLILSDTFTGKQFDSGQSVFAWAGDTWPGGEIGGRIADVINSEAGFFYLSADGTPVFEDRHTRPKHTSPDASISGGLIRLDAEASRQRMANHIEVTIYPREASAQAVLWRSVDSLRLERNSPRKLTARYKDPTLQSEVIGATEVIQPVRWQDYTASTAHDGGGTEATSAVAVECIPGATSATLILTSRWPTADPIFVHSLQIRGKPLRSYQPLVIVREDGEAITLDGKLPLTVDMPLQNDALVAGDLADVLLGKRKDPHAWLEVRVEAAASIAMLTHALARDIGDRLLISDETLGLDGIGCFIDHIRHCITRGGASHRVIWRTSPADLTTYWILGRAGFSELEQTTLTGY